MKNHRIFFFLSLVIALAIVFQAFAAGNNSPNGRFLKTAENGGLDQIVYLPVVESGLTPIIPDTTEVLTAESTQYLTSVSGDGSVFTFSQITPELGELEPGSIMVSGPADVTPYGFLRQVTSVDYTGGQVLVNTSFATLEDAVEQGEFTLNQTIVTQSIKWPFRPAYGLNGPTLLLLVEGIVQRQDNVTNILATRISPLTLPDPGRASLP